MNVEQKRYIVVFTGLFLIILGGLLYMKSLKKSSVYKQKEAIKAYIKANKVEKLDNVFVPYKRPTKLNFVYDEGVDFKRSVFLFIGNSVRENDHTANLAEISGITIKGITHTHFF